MGKIGDKKDRNRTVVRRKTESVRENPNISATGTLHEKIRPPSKLTNLGRHCRSWKGLSLW
jgi:hypothetical protein